MEGQHLLERILDGDKDPTDLPLALLKDITNDFSEERRIGHGGFGVVYKGQLGNKIVAVKRMHMSEHTVDDKAFRREINSLMNTKHENVVQFLGFCSHTHREWMKHTKSGETNLVNVNERLLVSEYISNGSLDKLITDELRGLEWETRYEIITGICKGLRYLHEDKNIIHMDLKPENILLYHQDRINIVPKITDFGLSRSNKNSRTMGLRFGTPGYVAPEYGTSGETSFECDIYSLGAIILELVTGCIGAPDKNNVLRRWRHRWNKPPTSLQYQQVTRCIDIAVRCKAQEPEARPSICDIIRILNESERNDGHTGQKSTYLNDDMLGIEPLELHFTFELNKEMARLVKLTNKTKACFAFNITRPSKQYTIRPDKGIVTPECNEYLVQITLQPQERFITQNGDKFIVHSTKVSEVLRVEDITGQIFRGEVVDEVNLMVVYEHTKPQESYKRRDETNTPPEEVPKAEQRKIGQSSFGKGKLGSSENAGATSMVMQETTELLDIRPMELRFPFEPNKLITCPLYLMNNRDHHVAFRLQPQGPKTAERYYHDWLCGVVPPRSTYTLNVTMKEQKKPPPLDKDDILIILSSIISGDKIYLISQGKRDIEYYNFFSEVEEKGINKVHELKLKAVFDPQGATTTEIIPMLKYSAIVSMDVHPTMPWIITNHYEGHFRIWNYETKSMVHKATREQEDISCDFWTSKFVERKQWIVAGGGDGCIYVYDYNTMEKVTSLKTHRAPITSLAIHPTKPYVLAASHDWKIEMWDWEKGPKSARTFKGHNGSVYQISFNPKDANTFATVSEDKKIKIWSIDSLDAITLTGPGHESEVRCLDYFSHADEQYLITGSDDGTAKIWDLKKKCCVKTLEGHTRKVSTVCSHPILPLLMTGSLDGTIRLWDSNSFRLKGVRNFGLKKVHALGCIMEGSGRVVIGYSRGLAILPHEDIASISENTL